MRKLIIFVVVIAVLLVAADRIGDSVAEHLVGDKIKSSQGLQQRPDVSIDGIPFLTQFASGHYQHIEVDARDVRVGSTSLYVSTLDTDFRTVTVSHSFHDFTARTATATATVDYAAISALLHVPVRYAGKGRLELTKKFPVVGRKTVTFRASYANGVLRFGQAAIDGAGNIGSEIASVLSNYFGIRTPLRDFPFHIRVRSLGVDASGLRIGLSGSDVSYSS